MTYNKIRRLTPKEVKRLVKTKKGWESVLLGLGAASLRQEEEETSN